MATFSPAVEEFFFDAPVRLREELFLTVTMKSLLTLLQALGAGEGKDAVLWRKTYADMRFVVRNAFSNRSRDNWVVVEQSLLPRLREFHERPLRSPKNLSLQGAYQSLRPALEASGNILYEGSIKPALLLRILSEVVDAHAVCVDVLGRTGLLVRYVEDYVVKKGRRPLTRDTLAAVDAYITDGLLLGDDE